MNQTSFELIIDNHEPQLFLYELKKLLKSIKEISENRHDTGIYLHMLFRMTDREIARQARELVGEFLPRAVVTGMSETVFGALNKTAKVKLNFTYFQSAHVQLLEFAGCPGKNYEAEGRRLGKLAAAIPQAKAVAVYASGVTTDFHAFIRSFEEENQEQVIFGATSGMFELSADAPGDCRNFFAFNKLNREEQQFVIGSRMLEIGMVMAVFSGDDLHVRGDCVLGWKTVGKEMTVTETLGNNCIARIDDLPATEIYRRYLQVKPDENFVFNITEFPIVVERNGMLMARVPPRYDEKGRIYFSSDIYEGEKVRLSYAVHEQLLRETEAASGEMGRFAPNAVFLTICGNRTVFLKDKAGMEKDYYRRFAGNLICNYGTSEIYCHKGQGGLLNSAFVAVGMREGAAEPSFYCQSMTPGERDEHRIIPLAERMATFLDATSQELTDMAQAAKAASLAKSQFLSNMSHEIRTPINAVLGMDEMILREAKGPQIREYAENIRAAGTTLLGLINDILDFSKIEAGKMEIIPVEYAVSSLLNDLVNMIAQRAAKKGLRFHVEAAEDLPSIMKGDEIRLRQIVINMLTNAVKYTEKGSVTLRFDWEKAGACAAILKVAVEDTGIGIKEEDMEKLYHAFERIEEKRNRTIEGTGLGMNITQRLLALMGSKLEVQSTYGEGSVFSFSVKQEVLNWEPMGDFEEAYRRTVSNQEKYRESFVAPTAKILVVDDTAMNLTVVKGLLKQTMMQVKTASSGYEGLAMAEKENFDVIFLDHRMPGMDGVETLKRMQSLKIQAPIIVLTANAVSGAREEYMAAGFDDYLTKPIDSRKLEEMLLRFLPPDKIERAGSRSAVEEKEVTLPDWLVQINGLDTALGVKHCGGVEPYLDALTVFASSIISNAAEIQRYFEQQDCPNYTTKVHALKSSARVIGAMELSEKARRLEDAGNNGYVEEIKAETKPLLDLYRSFAASLSRLIPQEQPDREKAPINQEELMEAWMAMGEAVAAFDFDSLQYMLSELDKYSLPDQEIEKLTAVKKAAAVPDWEELQRIMR